MADYNSIFGPYAGQSEEDKKKNKPSQVAKIENKQSRYDEVFGNAAKTYESIQSKWPTPTPTPQPTVTAPEPTKPTGFMDSFKTTLTGIINSINPRKAAQDKLASIELPKVDTSKIVAPILPISDTPLSIDPIKQQQTDSYLKFPSLFPNPDFIAQEADATPRPLTDKPFADVLIEGTRDILTAHPKALEVLTNVQEFLQNGKYGYGSDTSVGRFEKGLIEAPAKIFFGSSDEMRNTFDIELARPARGTGDKVASFVGNTVGAVLGYSGAIITGKGLGLGAANLPVIFGTLGQLSKSSQATVAQRIESLPVDVTAGYLFSVIPGAKGFSGAAVQNFGKASGVVGVQTFINGLIDGMKPEEAAKVSAAAMMTGGLLYVTGSAFGFLGEQLVGNKSKAGKAVLSPNDIRARVVNTDTAGSEFGKFMLKVADEGQASGKNLEFDYEAIKRSFVADKLNLKTLSADGKPVSQVGGIKYKLVDAPSTIGGPQENAPAIVEIGPNGKEVVPATPPTSQTPPSVIPPVVPDVVKNEIIKAKNKETPKLTTPPEAPQTTKADEVVTYSAGVKGPTDFSTTDKQFSEMFNDKPGSAVHEVIVKPSEYLDTRIPEQRQKLSLVIGKEKLDTMIGRTDNGLPNHYNTGDQETLQKAAGELGFKGIQLSETTSIEKYNGRDVISFAKSIAPESKPQFTPAEAEQLKNLNQKVNMTNTEKVVAETLAGNREDKRVNTDKTVRIAQLYNPQIKKGVTPETTISVYRAGKAGEIKAGDHVTVSKANAENYIKDRIGAVLLNKDVQLKDLVFSEGKKNEFIYAPVISGPSTASETKPKNIEERVKQARTLGVQAFADGKKSVPNLDAKVMKLLEGLDIGEGTPILEAWSEAWHVANSNATVPESGKIGNDNQIHTTGNGPTGGGVSESVPVVSGQSENLNQADQVASKDLEQQRPPTSNDQSGNGLTKTVNEEIKSSVESITSISNDGEVVLSRNPTNEELALYRKYQTAGGMEKKGAEGRGLLDEYFTPKKVVNKTWEVVKRLLNKNSNLVILEPSAGTGIFVESGLETIPNAEMYAYEINPLTAKITKALNPVASVYNLPFEDFFITSRGVAKTPGQVFDVVIGNPPYGEHRGEYLGLGELKGVKDYESYFIDRGMNLLNDNGVLAMVVPSSFLTNGFTFAKEDIAKQGYLVDAYRLPNGAFANTTIGTDIVVLRKSPVPADTNTSNTRLEIQKRVELMNRDSYFQANPDHVLGTVSEGTGNYGANEVKGTLEEANTKLEKLLSQTKTPAPEIKSPQAKAVETQTASKVTRSEPKAKTTTKRAWVQTQKITDSRVVKSLVDPASIDVMELEAFKNTLSDGSLDLTYAQNIAPKHRLEKFSYANGKWFLDFNYLQGNIYSKLDQLEIDKPLMDIAQYSKQKLALAAVLPAPVTIKSTQISPVSPFARMSRITYTDRNGAPYETSLHTAFKDYIRTLPNSAFGGLSVWDIEGYLDGTSVTGSDKERNERVRKLRVEIAGSLFNNFLDIVDEFKSDNSSRIEIDFNKTFNGFYQPRYDKVPLLSTTFKTFKGSELKLNDAQKNGIGFLLSKGLGGLAHDVGVGKTMSNIIAVNEVLMRGWAKKPLVVVGENVHQQWINEIKRILPEVTVNDLGNFGGNFKGTIGELKTAGIQDGSITIVTTEGLRRLGFTQDTYDSLSSDIQEITDIVGDKTKRQKAKEYEKVQQTVGQSKKKTMEDITFEDLGFDHISFDEVHLYNKIIGSAKPNKESETGRKMANEYRSLQLQPSDQGIKAFTAAMYIQKLMGGRNVFWLSATPFTNNPLEYYSILSLTARNDLRERGLYNVNDFIDTFLDISEGLEFTAQGQLAVKQQIRGFRNYDQFYSLLTGSIDFVDGEEAGVRRPKKEKQDHKLSPSKIQVDILDQIATEMQKISGSKIDAGKRLSLLQKTIQTTFSPYSTDFFKGEKPDYRAFVDNSPKIKATIELIKQNKIDAPNANQVIYMPFVKSSTGLDYYALVKEYLVKELKYTSDQVAMIKGDVSATERARVQKQFNEGKIKVLLGSSSITTGLDLQSKSTDMFLTMLPWNFTDLRQLSGRIWRQGNQWKSVRIHSMLLENSSDIFVSQKLANKEARYKALTSGKKTGEANNYMETGLISYDEIKNALSTDPVTAVKAKAFIETERLGKEARGLQGQLAFLEKKFNAEEVSKLEQQVDKAKIDVNNYKKWGENDKYFADKLPEVMTQYENIKAKLEKLKADRTAAGIDMTQIETVKGQLADIKTKQEGLKGQFDDELKAAEKQKSELVLKEPNYDSIIKALAEQNKTFFQIDPEVRQYQAPTGNADVGGYADIPTAKRTVERIKAIEFPELVRIAKALTGNPIRLQAFKKALGKFYGNSEEGRIKLNLSVFDNPELATKVLAHEIGHLADWLPDKTLSRGNVVGRIASLNKFMRSKFGMLANKDIKNELKSLTQIWKPFDDQANINFTKYRYSSKELYADAVSVLLNDPALLQEVAPKFFEGFFEYLSLKPEVESAYYETMELLNAGPDKVNEARLNEIYDGYKKAADKALEIESRVRPVKRWVDTFMRNHVTKNSPIYSKLKNLGTNVDSPYHKARLIMEEYQYRDSRAALFLKRVQTNIAEALNGIGLSEQDFGAILELERDAFGDRNTKANPGGLIGAIPQDVLQHLYKTKGWTPEQISVLNQIKDKFHKMIYSEVKRAVKNGNYNKKVFLETIKPNRKTYATFRVVHYIERNYISAGIKKMVGTLSEIENPFNSTVLKTISLIHWNDQQEAKTGIISLINENNPDDISVAAPIRGSQGRVVGFKSKENMEVLEYMIDGKKAGVHVDPYIQSMFESDFMTPEEQHGLITVAKGFNKVFKPLVTTYNVSWGFYSNIIRDFKRTYKSLGAGLAKYGVKSSNVFDSAVSIFGQGSKERNFTLGEFLQTWISSVPDSYKFQKDQLTDLTREMVKNKALTESWANYDPNANNDSILAPILRKYKLMGKTDINVKPLRKIFNLTMGKVLDAIKFSGGIFETTTKVAGYKIASRRVKDGRELGFITRNYVGTPNYMEGGKYKETDNSLFVFSNIMIQSLRADIELATDPQTRSGYWWRTFMVDIVPKILMLMGLAGVFGKLVKDNFEKQTEYDKTNYITVPFGTDPENGKAVYVRLPQDETGRLFSAFVWKMGTFLVNKKVIKPEQLASLGAGYLPSETPIFEIMNNWVQYVQGRNPYDSFRGRTAIADTTWNAGGMYRLKAMVQYTLNQTGISNFTTYDDTSKSTQEVAIGAIPVVNRMFKESNFGLQEKYADIKAEELSKRSIRTIDENKEINAAIKEERPIDATKALGHAPTTKEDIAKINTIVKKYIIQKQRGFDPYLDALIGATTNAEKISLLTQYSNDLDPEEFGRILTNGVAYKIISNDVLKQFGQ